MELALGKGNTNIVITGRSSVGKTVLHSRMRGITEDYAYEIPEIPSRDVESSVVTVKDWSQIVRVIPGQGIQERYLGLYEAFSSHDDLDGVVYVVDWGFTQVRDTVVERKMIEDGIDSIAKIRQFNLDREVEDFAIICSKIKENFARCRRPKWLLIAVNKADLFMEDLDQAKKYYHPTSVSQFTTLLGDLQDSVGSQNLRCGSVPVSSSIKNRWNKRITRSFSQFYASGNVAIR